MFSELMLGGMAINSKATSAGRKGCHEVIILEEKFCTLHQRKNIKMVLLAMPGPLL
jgi:hypothetical protein